MTLDEVAEIEAQWGHGPTSAWTYGHEESDACAKCVVGRLCRALREAWEENKVVLGQRKKAEAKWKGYRNTLVQAGLTKTWTLRDENAAIELPEPETLAAILDERDRLRAEVKQLQYQVAEGGRTTPRPSQGHCYPEEHQAPKDEYEPNPPTSWTAPSPPG